ncbi:hypothetical protein SDC9_177391 [bioreactor metagenome]|uniref:Uncharacterized protein n=1 Tax=bioreactor metagenome TaxID=1076179 RepID=A0A645H0U3_9ZZZZ
MALTKLWNGTKTLDNQLVIKINVSVASSVDMSAQSVRLAKAKSKSKRAVIVRLATLSYNTKTSLNTGLFLLKR